MRFYKLESQQSGEKLTALSTRQQRLIESAVNYHSLIQPGRTLKYKIYMGQKWQYPRLMDTSTLNGVLTDGAGLEPFLEFSATSLVEPKSVFSPHYFAGDEQIIDRNVRYILLTPDDATDTDVEVNNPQRRLSRIYSKLETNTPVLLDTLREAQRKRGELIGRKEAKHADAYTTDFVNRSGDVHHPWVEVRPGTPRADAPQAILIGMHWLQAGGAERWALETVALAKQAGYIPIVITDRDSHQPWITRPEFDDAVVLNLTHPLQERVGDATLLRAVFEQFNVAGVLVHHCQWLYDRLWWIKKYFAATPVMDSLHIVEYKFGGGYPHEAVTHDKWIDIHHVISPQLEQWLTQVHGIDPQKIVDAPLIDLTAHTSEPQFQPRHDEKSLTVAFVGRLARQKRLEAFLLLASKLHKSSPNTYKFIMHGSGSMDIVRDEIVRRLGLEGVVEFRGQEVSVSQTYADSDVLVVSSVNEGITLTTIEALRAGIPVISANVGSQYTLIPPQGLSRRSTYNFVKDTMRSLDHLLRDESTRERLWVVENDNLNEFAKLETANSFVTRLLHDWKKND
ncbi:glycosyltransferase [Alloscardovia venturai]|uniref:Glycosyltransferase n=1 Tax=Alloscardovia venturai TaxID=1769421 RepID=A0ABW2Y380_9BIFI